MWRTTLKVWSPPWPRSTRASPMPPANPLTLSEYSHCEIDHEAPSPVEREALERELGQRQELTWLASSRLRIRSSSWVGVVRLPDGTTVRIVPKLAGDEL